LNGSVPFTIKAQVKFTQPFAEKQLNKKALQKCAVTKMLIQGEPGLSPLLAPVVFFQLICETLKKHPQCM